MLFIVCRDGVPVKSWSEPMQTWDSVVIRLKQIYIAEQSQEIYMLTENTCPHWFAASFRFKVLSSGMHPDKAAFNSIEVDKLPKQVRMQHLLGAL